MNVKQGDLAIVVNAFQTPSAEGRIVEVLRLARYGDFISEARYEPVEHGGPDWVVRCVSGRPLEWEGDMVPERVFHDRHLRPVSGLPVEEYDRLMEKEPA